MSRVRQTKIATPSNPPASTEELYYATAGTGVGTPAALQAIDESGNILHVGGFGILDYRLIKVTAIAQGTTTYTPSNGCRALFVECLGGGGAGGGVATAATNSGAAGGGGSGAYSAVWLTGASVKSSFTVAVGAGGTAGTAGANPGNAGGDTTFDSPSVCTAKGGSGGLADTVTTIHAGGIGGAGGASASGVGDWKSDGNAGGPGVALAAAQAVSGAGGASMWGGAAASVKAQGAGTNATSFGGGGSGGCILSGGASVAGGTGANGRIRVWEFA